jgi:PAS domain S-box-containing protein
VVFNRAFRQFAGWDSVPPAVDPWESLLHPEDLREWRETYASAHAAKQEYRIESRMRREDGEYRWVHWTITPSLRDRRFLGYCGAGIDITVRKRAEEAIRTGTVRYVAPSEPAPPLREVLEITGDLVFTQDATGRYTSCTGVLPPPFTVAGVIGRLPGEIFPPELAGEIMGRTRAVLATGVPMTVERAGFWGDASRWRMEILSPVRDASGRTTGVLTVSQDTTAHHALEERAHTSEERYRSIVERSIDGFWRFETREPIPIDLPTDEQIERILRHAYLAECNDATARMHGAHRASDIVGMPIGRFIEVENPDDLRFLRTFIAGGYRLSDAEMRQVDADGQVRFFVYNFAGWVEDGHLLAAWGSQSEITQRRLADRELRLLAQTVTSTKDSISITDLQDTILFVNDAFLATYGYTEEELVGRKISVVRSPLTSPEVGAAILPRSLEGGWNGEILNRKKDGTDFPIELWTSVVRNDDGAPVAIVGVARDITERKKAEEQIRASLHEKEVLLKEIHHRVKNNMQVISSLMSLQADASADPETLRFLRESQNRVKSMALIHEKLYQSSNLARIDFGGYARDLAGHLLRSYRMGPDQVSLHVEAGDTPLGIDQAIPAGIILNELVSNALKYAFVGAHRGGRLLVAIALEGDGHLRLTVSDDGAGLPAHLDVQASETLGLKLVRMLASQLQGKLEVVRRGESLGATTGAEFRLRFHTAQNITGVD